MAGADIEPDRIKLITPDHMNQSMAASPRKTQPRLIG
jgi:hypothetical protein